MTRIPLALAAIFFVGCVATPPPPADNLLVDLEILPASETTVRVNGTLQVTTLAENARSTRRITIPSTLMNREKGGEIQMGTQPDGCGLLFRLTPVAASHGTGYRVRLESRRIPDETAAAINAERSGADK